MKIICQPLSEKKSFFRDQFYPAVSFATGIFLIKSETIMNISNFKTNIAIG
jgi:hypothetical protein